MIAAMPQPNSPLEVTVSPTQSSFFAGEELRCMISFRNLHFPIPHSQPLPSSTYFGTSSDHDSYAVRSASHHAQGSSTSQHSRSQTIDWRHGSPRPSTIGEATATEKQQSQTLQNSALHTQEANEAVQYDRNGVPLPKRRNVIGQTARISNNMRPSKHSKSASISTLSMPSKQLRWPSDLGKGHPSSSQVDSTHGLSTSTLQPTDKSGSNGRSPIASWSRKPSSTIHSKHPHSRKQSVVQLQREDLSAAFELSDTPEATRPPGSHTLYAQKVNPSSLSLASNVDPSRSTSRNVTPSADVTFEDAPRVVNTDGSAFYSLGQNETMESVVRDQFTHWSQGAPSPRSNTSAFASGAEDSHSSPLFSRQSTFGPDTEILYWSFAQFSGNYEIDESLIKPAEFENVKRRLAFGDGLSSPSPQRTSRTIGGGDLGHLDEIGSDTSGISSGWGAYLRGVLGRQRSSSDVASRNHRRSGSTMLDISQRMMSSKSIPLFSSPPSIVAVDLNLSPGQSRTYSFSIRLPADLPPSYFGRAVSFKYELIVGTNRLDRSRSAAGSGHQRSRLIRIPLRIYNHVGVTEARPFFDLTNPVILLKDEAIVREEGGGQEMEAVLTQSQEKLSSVSRLAVPAKTPKQKDGECYK